MSKAARHFDVLVIGGGLFGAYSALHAARDLGLNVCLIEREQRLFRKASIVNQARIHGGYHYPRSIATAQQADSHKQRFVREHAAFINSSFAHYYGIDRYASFTDAAQFQRFCQYVGIRADRVKSHPCLDTRRLEAIFEVTEHSFDPLLIANYYTQLLREEQRVDLRVGIHARSATINQGRWEVELVRDGEGEVVRADHVINATYAATNAVNCLFGIEPLPLVYELAEMAFVESEAFRALGLTVMDGYFGSLMPYGLSGKLSLSGVGYTPHAVSRHELPTFACQERRAACTPDAVAICATCPERPKSNFRRMRAQMSAYLAPNVSLRYQGSLFTVKTKLLASHIDDSRPTVITRLRREPSFFCLFAGKINSVYEIESQLAMLA